MQSRTSAWLALVPAIVTSGCVVVQARATATVPPRPAECSVVVANRPLPADKPIGSVCVAKPYKKHLTPDELLSDEDAFFRTRERVCQLGGDLMVPVAPCVEGKTHGYVYAVYRGAM